MAPVILFGAMVLAAIGGVMQARESVLFFYVGLPFALCGVVAHVVAAVWPARDDSGKSHPRVRAAVLIARVVLGLTVGVLGFAAGASYGINHQAWFGERVTAEVTDDRRVCGQNMTGCGTDYHLADGDRDLGWLTHECGSVPEVRRIEVDADPLGWVPPDSPACVSQRE